LRLIQEREFSWGLVSNGLLIPQKMDLLKARGIFSLTLSLDGEEYWHDWLRGRPGAHARTLEALRVVMAAKLPVMDVVTCVHPGNLEELPAILNRLQSLGVSRWRLFAIFPQGRATEQPELMLSGPQLRSLLEWISAQRRRLEGRFRLDFSCEAYLPPKLDTRVRNEPYFCRAGISIASVLYDGSVSACPNIDRSLVQGNILEDDLLKIWERRFQDFRDRGWMRSGECTDCGDWDRCQGNSLHLWSPKRAQPSLCHAQMVEAESTGAHGFCSGCRE